MRVLVACEFTGAVRRAFRERGHDAWSCDLIPAEDGGPHFEMDVRKVPMDDWNLLVGHPPCTHLAVSGSRWFKEKRAEQEKALEFVRWLMGLPIERIAIENPVSVISSRIRKPDQIVQPYWFGHPETKATCLWLKNLPKLVATNMVEGREPRIHWMSPGPMRGRARSRTPAGFAQAMADQWSNVLVEATGEE